MTQRTQRTRGDTTYILSLDLGQAADYSAIAGVERRSFLEDDRVDYHVPMLKRWQLKTPYTEIVADVQAMLQRPPLRDANPLLAVDQTGVGAAVVDMFKQADLPAILRPIHITAGHDAHSVDGIWMVPKKDLVSAMQVVMQQQRLGIESGLKLADVLMRELQEFSVKVTAAGNEGYESWRTQSHDDIVLALAMAVWLGEQIRPFVAPTPIDSRPMTLAEREDRRRREGYPRGMFGYGRYRMQ